MKQEYIVICFYKFVRLENLEDLKAKLLSYCKKNNMRGTILLAHEGINAFVAFKPEMQQEFFSFITSIPEFSDIRFKPQKSSMQPFERMKVKIKDEIVSFRKDLDMSERGEYLNSDQWDDLIQQKDTLLIDTRNYYEYAIGTFKNAINPYVQNFTEFADWVDKNVTEKDKEKNIAMFCTGGIRCEKSTAYLKNKGFKNVFHLQDGIIQYIDDRKSSNKTSLWEGECFVFDDRVVYK